MDLLTLMISLNFNGDCYCSDDGCCFDDQLTNKKQIKPACFSYVSKFINVEPLDKKKDQQFSNCCCLKLKFFDFIAKFNNLCFGQIDDDFMLRKKFFVNVVEQARLGFKQIVKQHDVFLNFNERFRFYCKLIEVLFLVNVGQLALQLQRLLLCNQHLFEVAHWIEESNSLFNFIVFKAVVITQ